jgi:hypothetical protein
MFRSVVFVGLIGLKHLGVLASSSPDINPYNYTIINGQIFTPGLSIVDAPQPNTPLGGGQFSQTMRGSSNSQQSQIISRLLSMSATMVQLDFLRIKKAPLQRYITSLYFCLATIQEGTSPFQMALPPEMPVWETSWHKSPAALSSMSTGIGLIAWLETAHLERKVPRRIEAPTTYVIFPALRLVSSLIRLQISMHQNFALNGSNHYTIFDLPIQVTNSIPSSDVRPPCGAVNNKLLPGDQGNATGPPVILPSSVPKSGGPQVSRATLLVRLETLSSPGVLLAFAAILVHFL